MIALSFERAQSVYLQFLERQFDGEEIGEILRFLDLSSAAGEGVAAAARRITEFLAAPGALEKALRAQCAEVLRLLLELLDGGLFHLPHALQSALADKSPEEKSAAFFILKRLGLVWMEGAYDPPLIALQPWTGHLLAEALKSHRVDRFRQARFTLLERFPLRPLLILGLNCFRGKPLRLNKNGAVFARDRKKGEGLFQFFQSAFQVPGLDFAILCLTRLKALQITRENTMEVEPEGIFPILREDGGPLQAGLLTVGRDGFSSGLSALEYLRSRAEEYPEGWIPAPHLASGEFAVALNRLSPVSPGRALEELEELYLLGLMEEGKGGLSVDWLRISAAGKRLLAGIEAADAAGAAGKVRAEEEKSVPPELQAIVQPNLEVLVPLEAPPWIHWQVGAAARLESIDAVCRYVMDREHAQYLFTREEIPFGEWLADAARWARHGMPENVAEILRAWLARTSAVEVVSGTVVCLQGELNDAARAALEAAARKLEAQRLAPGVFVVKGSERKYRIVQALQRQGLQIKKTGKDAAARTEDQAGQRLEALRRGLERSRLRRRQAMEEIAVWSHQEREAPSGSLSLILRQSAETGEAVEIVLDQSYGNQRWIVQPKSITQRGSRYYVLAECAGTSEYRAFPIDSIARVRLLKN